MREFRTLRREGFTLVELLIVVFIMALLTTLIIPSARLALAKAQHLKCKTNLDGQLKAHFLYAADNNQNKPPLIWKLNKKTRYFVAAVNVRMQNEPLGQGILVAEGYMPLRMLFCAASSMADDRAIDEEAWDKRTISGSSYSYFWRHSSTIDNADDVMAPFTFGDSQREGRFGVAMDFNAAAGHTYIGAYDDDDWDSHPLLGFVNISYSDGTVHEKDNSKIVLQFPFGRDARIAWWDLAHEAH